MAGPISLVQAYQEEERACFCGSKRLDFQSSREGAFSAVGSGADLALRGGHKFVSIRRASLDCSLRSVPFRWLNVLFLSKKVERKLWVMNKMPVKQNGKPPPPWPRRVSLPSTSKGCL